VKFRVIVFPRATVVPDRDPRAAFLRVVWCLQILGLKDMRPLEVNTFYFGLGLN
jgi:hypothetical protein